MFLVIRKNISKVSVVSGLRKECCTKAADVELTRRVCQGARCNEISQPIFKLLIERVFFSAVFEAQIRLKVCSVLLNIVVSTVLRELEEAYNSQVCTSQHHIHIYPSLH